MLRVYIELMRITCAYMIVFSGGCLGKVGIPQRARPYLIYAQERGSAAFEAPRKQSFGGTARPQCIPETNS